MTLNSEDYIEMYKWLFLIRNTEEAMVSYHMHTPLTELPHSSIGQEAVSVGTCYALRETDFIAPSLRTRGAFIMKGVPSEHMMAGAFGKDIPETRGKNTSHHLGDRKKGIIAGTGIVASHLPVSVGFALASKIKKKDDVTLTYFGDGATNRGDFHEALNLAAIWDLPVIFICENNRYAISMPIEKSMKIDSIVLRGNSYGIPSVSIDGNNVLEVYEETSRAIERARNGEGPTLIECNTYRFRNHSERDPRDLRDPREVEQWKLKDPVKNFRELILTKKHIDEEELENLENQVKNKVQADVKFAEKQPFPPAEIIWDDVYYGEK